MSILRDRPAYDKARASALRCLKQKKRRAHDLSIVTIANTFATEWGLDDDERTQLEAIIRKAS